MKKRALINATSIPTLATIVLFVAMVDELIQVAGGKDPSAPAPGDEPAHIE